MFVHPVWIAIFAMMFGVAVGVSLASWFLPKRESIFLTLVNPESSPIYKVPPERLEELDSSIRDCFSNDVSSVARALAPESSENGGIAAVADNVIVRVKRILRVGSAASSEVLLPPVARWVIIVGETESCFARAGNSSHWVKSKAPIPVSGIVPCQDVAVRRVATLNFIDFIIIEKISSRICLEILRPPTDSSSHFAEHGPIQFEACPVPPNHGFWQDQHECALPSRPEPANYNPEQFVQWTEPGPRILALEHGEWLEQC
jgi:hypothetical protein